VESALYETLPCNDAMTQLTDQGNQEHDAAIRTFYGDLSLESRD